MGRLDPQIKRFFEDNSTNFNEFRTAARNNLIQVNGSYEISQLRDLVVENGNASTESVDAEFKLSYQTAGDEAGILTAARGRYVPGHPAQAGIGARIPEMPQNDVEAKWGYFDTATGTIDVLDGAYFGVDNQGIFVGINRAGEEVDRVYQPNWNTNEGQNFDFDMSKGLIYQINFVYYGYGVVRFEIIDPETERKRIVHRYIAEGETTFRNSNLKVAATIKGNEDEDFEIFVSGRQFSIVGEPVFRERRISHLTDDVEIAAGDWETIVSARKEAGRRPVTITLQSVEVDTNRSLELELRVNADLENENEEDWETPHRHDPEEVSIEVNEVANVQEQTTDNPPGVKIAGFLVAGGAGPNPRVLSRRGLPQELPDAYTVSLLARNRSSEQATASFDITLIEER